MLIAARYLVDRMRGPASRADELIAVRRRLQAQPGRDSVSSGELELAQRMGELRQEMSRALGNARSCSSCTRGYPLPEGRWDGGHCCTGDTLDIFNANEVAALGLAGTGPGDLTPPRADHAGCAFRGPTGCSLAPRHRPTVCARYLCGELRGELARSDELPAIIDLLDELDDAFEAFLDLRSRRMEREELAAIHPDLVSLE